MPWQRLVECHSNKEGGNPGFCSKRIFNTVRRARVLEFLGGDFRVLRFLLLMIDVLDQQGVHDLPLSVLTGSQLWIIQQLVDHSQIVFFALAKKKTGRKESSVST